MNSEFFDARASLLMTRILLARESLYPTQALDAAYMDAAEFIETVGVERTGLTRSLYALMAQPVTLPHERKEANTNQDGRSLS